MSRPLRVFLCHASQDKPVVRELYQRLEAEEWIDAWLDEEKLSFGQHWTTVIEDALHDADVVIIFLSTNSVQKEGFVQRELNYAWELSLEKPRHVIFLIPFRLDDCEIPRYLAARQWGDYFGEKKESTYQILLRSLKQRHLQKLQLEAAEDVGREKLEREAKEKMERENAEAAAREKDALQRNMVEKARRNAVQEQEYQERAERIVSEETEAKPDKEKQEDAYRREIENERLNNIIAEEIVQENILLEQARKSALEKKNRDVAKLRQLGIGGFILVALIAGGLGLNFLLNKLLDSIAPSFNLIIDTDIPKSLTSTYTPSQPTIQLTKTRTPVPTFTPTPGIGSTMISEKDGMVMVFVPAGDFIMGSDSYSGAQPIHQVYLDAFWIDQTEVTNAMYIKCVGDSACSIPSSKNSFSHDNYYGNPYFNNFPVIYVNWDQANDYCTWAKRKLPTEAEWEKAARGADERTYPWGEEISCYKANYFARRYCVGDTTEVGKYPSGASPYGAYDMAGNVWEWVNDWYDGNYYQVSPILNPQGPVSGQYKVLRGGAWSSYYTNIYSVLRHKYVWASTNYSIGFRCALSHP